MQGSVAASRQPAAATCRSRLGARRAVPRAVPLHSAASFSRRQQQQLAHPGAPGCLRQRRAVLAAAAPSDFDKERFHANNKDYAVLTQQIEDTAKEVVEGLQGTSLFLIGMMGSGKSTVGKLISQALGYCFFDTDTLIEQLSQKKISELIGEDGEASFRELETQVLAELSPFKNCVVATGGGVPTKAENWGHMQGGVSVWLNGPPTLLAHRVVGDGIESRPLLSTPGEGEGAPQQDAYSAAVARLTALLEERRSLYQIADLAVSLEGTGPDADIGVPAMEVCYRVLAALNERIKTDAEERRRRMDFEIVREELPSTMRVVESPVAQREMEDPFLP